MTTKYWYPATWDSRLLSLTNWDKSKLARLLLMPLPGNSPRCCRSNAT